MSTHELHEAARRGDKDEVERLLDEEGVDVDSMNRVSVFVCFACSFWCCLGQNGTTALLWSSESGHLNVIHSLLERGANPLIKDTVSRVCL